MIKQLFVPFYRQLDNTLIDHVEMNLVYLKGMNDNLISNPPEFRDQYMQVIENPKLKPIMVTKENNRWGILFETIEGFDDTIFSNGLITSWGAPGNKLDIYKSHEGRPLDNEDVIKFSKECSIVVLRDVGSVSRVAPRGDTNVYDIETTTPLTLEIYEKLQISSMEGGLKTIPFENVKEIEPLKYVASNP